METMINDYKTIISIIDRAIQEGHKVRAKSDFNMRPDTMFRTIVFYIDLDKSKEYCKTLFTDITVFTNILAKKYQEAIISTVFPLVELHKSDETVTEISLRIVFNLQNTARFDENITYLLVELVKRCEVV